MRKSSKKVETEETEAVEVFNPLADVDKEIDIIEKSYSLSGASFQPGEKRQTTGLLGLDIVLSGGLVPGWYTNFGEEQSCKSTLTMWIMCAVLDSSFEGICSVFDYEGSAQPDYIANMMENFGLTENIDTLFGMRNPKTQKWEVKPKIRMYNPDSGEQFFDYLSRLQRSLPDKRLMDDQWYYVYKDTPTNKKLIGNRYDVGYYKKTGLLRLPAPNGNLQALILLDSYPAMLPEKQDVDDPGGALAVQARMFSEQLKRVKGRLRPKRIAVVGVNQLRKVPMAFGNPNQEPCGSALKFFSDCRLMSTAMSLSGVPINGFKGKGMVLEEASMIDGGIDKYRFIKVQAIKNKLSLPNQTTWIRLWIEDATGKARGFDPVWDAFYYLVRTGQLDGDGKKMTLKIASEVVSKKGGISDILYDPKFESKKTLAWHGFKTLILGTKAEQISVQRGLGWERKVNLRAFLRKQMDSPLGMELYIANKSKPAKKDNSRFEGGEEDEDE